MASVIFALLVHTVFAADLRSEIEPRAVAEMAVSGAIDRLPYRTQSEVLHLTLALKLPSPEMERLLLFELGRNPDLSALAALNSHRLRIISGHRSYDPSHIHVLAPLAFERQHPRYRTFSQHRFLITNKGPVQAEELDRALWKWAERHFDDEKIFITHIHVWMPLDVLFAAHRVMRVAPHWLDRLPLPLAKKYSELTDMCQRSLR